MTDIKAKTSRRAFFLQGSAVLGAGVATTVGAAALAPTSPAPLSSEEELKQLREQLGGIEDREAIRELHLAFTSLVESQAYDRVAALFDEHAQLQLSGASAQGKREIQELFAKRYRLQQTANFHSAYRQDAAKQGNSVTFSEDRLRASATFPVEVELCTPLQGDCTVAEMARLQGHVADRRWEPGRFDAKYVKSGGRWKIASLSYVPA